MQAPEIWFPHLGIQIAHLSRVAFQVFGFKIYWYGIIIVLGMLAGYYVTVREARRTGQNAELYSDFLLVVVLISVMGARLYYVIFSWDQYKDNLWEIFATREGGLAIYGGIIAAVITAYVYCRVKKLDKWYFTDTAVLGLVLGQAIGRWGNFINHEAFGSYTDSLLALRYLADTVPYIPRVVAQHMVTDMGAQYIQVHPTFLYESLWNLALFAILTLYRPRKKFHGEVTLLYFLGYGLGRAWIEGMRTDQLILFQTGLPASQVLSILLVIASVILLIYLRKRTAGTTPGASIYLPGAGGAGAETAESTSNGGKPEQPAAIQDEND